jgi:subtilisin-like proprotein convertase family protein
MKQTHHLSRLLLIGSIGLAALVACQAPDSAPDAFSFASKTGLSITETGNVESDAVTISGMNTPASISVTGGQYGIDGGACQSGPGTISLGQQLRLCAASPSKFAQENTVNVNVGGTSSSFTAVAENLEAIAFAPASFDPSGTVESTLIIPAWISSISELDVTASVTGVTNATGGFKIGAGSCQTTGKVKATDGIKACANVPSTTANGSKVMVTLEFGSGSTGKVSKTFEATVGPLTIESIVLTPGNFSAVIDAAKGVTLESNELFVNGIGSGSSATITVTPVAPTTTATLFINGVVKPSGSSISNNQKIKLALTSSDLDDTLGSASIKVLTSTGKEANATYSVRTAAALGLGEFKPDQAITDFRPLIPWARTDPTPPSGINVADTSPTCVYGSGGPWIKVSPGEANEFLYVRANGEQIGFAKSGLQKADWNSCPDNWSETDILAAGDAGQIVNGVTRKFGKTTLTFNVTGAGNVSKVELKLKVAHQSRADLVVTLISPTGTSVKIYDTPNDSLGNRIRGTQFSNPNAYDPAGYPLLESAGISLILADDATPPILDGVQLPAEAATLPYRCGPSNRTVGGVKQTGKLLGDCWNNAGTGTNKANYPGRTGFGSFGKVLPSNPLSAFNGQAIAGTWKLEIEDRAPGNQESNDDTFPPFRPLDLPGQNPKNDYSSPPRSVTAVPGDTKQLVRQATNGNLVPRVRVAVLTVK